MRTAFSSLHRQHEQRLLFLRNAESFGGDGGSLEPLGGFRRTGESTWGAIENVFGGTRQLIMKKGERFKDAARVGEGLLDFLDTPMSLIADGTRSLAGTPSNPHQPSDFHTVRALRHAADIRIDDPVNTIKDGIAVTVDNIHGLFKLGTDGLRLVRGKGGLALVSHVETAKHEGREVRRATDGTRGATTVAESDYANAA